MKKIMVFKATASIAVICIFCAPIVFCPEVHAQAQISNQDLMAAIAKDIKDVAVTWDAKIRPAAEFLFWSLAVISQVWTFGIMLVRKAELGEFFAELIKFIMFIGFFFWLLTNGTDFAEDIIVSMGRLGGDPTFSVNDTGTQGIMYKAFVLHQKLLSKWGWLAPIEWLFQVLVATGIFFLLLFIAFNLLTLMVSAWFLIYAGVIFLGFGGSRWTSDIAINYFKTVLGLGAQILAMLLMVSTGETIINKYYKLMGDDLNSSNLMLFLAVVLIIFLLVNKIPQMLAGVVSGAHGGTGGSAGLGFGTMMTGAMMLAGAASLSAKAAINNPVSQKIGKAVGDGMKDAGKSLFQGMARSSGGNRVPMGGKKPGMQGGSGGQSPGGVGGKGGASAKDGSGAKGSGSSRGKGGGGSGGKGGGSTGGKPGKGGGGSGGTGGAPSF